MNDTMKREKKLDDNIKIYLIWIKLIKESAALILLFHSVIPIRIYSNFGIL